MKLDPNIRRKGYRALDKGIIVLMLVLIAAFILWPLIAIVAVSFQKGGVFSLDYYRELFTVRSSRLIWNSLWTSLLSASVSTFVAINIALFAFVSSRRLKRMLERGAMIAMISPPFVSALAYIILFGRRGLITYGIFGLSANPYGSHGIVILQSIGGVAFASLMLLVNLEQVDAFQIMASRDLGARGPATIRHVVLPALLPGIYSVFFVLFTMNLADFSTPIVVGGNFRVLATEAYLQAISTPHLGRAAAISVLMVPSAMLAFYFYRKNMMFTQNASAQKRPFLETDLTLDVPLRLKLFMGFFVLLYFLVIILKYANIVLSAFSNTATGSIRFTLDYFRNLPPANSGALLRSVLYSFIAACLAAVIGIFVSYYTHRRRLRLMGSVEFITSLPYIIPGTFFGLGYLAAFSRPPLYLRGTAIILIANYAFRQLSVSIKGGNAAFNGIDPKLDEASRDLGAGKLQTFFNILLPQMKSTLISSFVTVFTASMTAVGAIIFVVSPGTNVAATLIFRSVEDGKYGQASVQALYMMIAIIAVNLIALSFRKAGVQRSNRALTPRTEQSGRVSDVPAKGE